MSLALYYSPGACSLAAHVALVSAGVPFELRRVTIAEGLHRTPAYLAVNPRGRVPALEVDGQIVTESTAILSYLALRFPDAGIMPVKDLARYARCAELLSFYVSSVHIAFAQVWRVERFTAEPAQHSGLQESGRLALLRYFDEIEALAGTDGWFVPPGCTVADIYPLLFYRWGRRIGVDTGGYPKWSKHTERVLQVPAVLQALAAEGLSPEQWFAVARTG
jgi:glutathione S-transferase